VSEGGWIERRGKKKKKKKKSNYFKVSKRSNQRLKKINK